MKILRKLRVRQILSIVILLLLCIYGVQETELKQNNVLKCMQSSYEGENNSTDEASPHTYSEMEIEHVDCAILPDNEPVVQCYQRTAHSSTRTQIVRSGFAFLGHSRSGVEFFYHTSSPTNLISEQRTFSESMLIGYQHAKDGEKPVLFS